LRFKITVGLLLSLIVVLAVSSYLRYASFKQLLVESLERSAANTQEIIETQMAAYVRSRLILTASSLIVILLIGDLMMSRIVVNRLKRFLNVVRQVSPGKLEASVQVGGRDEIAELAEAFNRMLDGLREKATLERKVQERTEELQRQTEKLSALNTLAATVSQSLNLKEILDSALDKILELMKLRVGWIVLWHSQGAAFDLMASRGLPEGGALTCVQCARARCICLDILELGQPKVFPNVLEHPCPATRYFQRERLLSRVCVPLKSKDRVLGVMSLVGDASSSMQKLTEDTLELLTAIGRQIGIAVENASLYEELRQKETLRRQLLQRVITAQEEERKRIARELHDETSQALTSLIVKLKVLEKASPLTEAQEHIEEMRAAVVKTLQEVHDLALRLRPSVLDDLGLVAALRHYIRDYEGKFHLPVDFQSLGFDTQRLPSHVETALYRVVQEALTNVARHAQAQSVSVLLQHRGTSVIAIIEDDGQGFEPTQGAGLDSQQRNLGLYGMQERASLLGGMLTIESTPGAGTAVFVEIPLKPEESGHEEDPSTGG